MGGLVIWLGIAFCVTQSAMFSGLNIAFFSLSRLQLDIEVAHGNRSAARVLTMREDASYLLTTILWGNVAINVLLTLLANSVLTGLIAFLFSTVLITFGGEIAPQAYFSRYALRMASLLAPVLRVYQFLLLPVALPTARLLDALLGREGIRYLREEELRQLIQRHMDAEGARELDRIEGTGALNFLALDDLPVGHEGEPVNPASVIARPLGEDGPGGVALPPPGRAADDGFLQDVVASSHKWVIITDPDGEPRLALDADGFLRDVMTHPDEADVRAHVHEPIVVTDPKTPIGRIIGRLESHQQRRGDDVIDRDLILLWGEQRRVITGADILGRLLRGIARPVGRSDQPERHNDEEAAPISERGSSSTC